MNLVRFQPRQGYTAPAREDASHPYQPLSRLHNDIDRLFQGFFGDFPTPFGGLRDMFSSLPDFLPSLDLKSDASTYTLSLELPGVAPEEVKVYNQGINVIPAPQSLVQHDGYFKLGNGTSFGAASPEAKTIAEFFAAKMRTATGYNIQVGEKGNITLNLDAAADVPNEEGYTLEVTNQGATVTAKTAQGLFYGMQTFMQLLPAEIESAQKVSGIAWQAPLVSVKDAPRFGYRGIHIDPCRHFMPIENMKKYIDVLSLFKINRIHWHLTDDQGWRIEIKKYPKLQEIASKRIEGEGFEHGGYYTQEEIKEVVQ